MAAKSMQFGIKSIFLLMALSAVAATISNFISRLPRYSESEAIHIIKLDKGSVEHSPEGYSVRVCSERSLHAIQYLVGVREVAVISVPLCQEISSLQKLPNLRSLTLQFSGTDQTLGVVSSIQSIRVLQVNSQYLSNQMAEHIGNMTHLKELRISSNLQVSPGTFSPLNRLRQLEKLDARGAITFSNVREIGPLPALKRLDVRGKGFSDDGLSTLTVFSSLECFTATNTSLSCATLNQFAHDWQGNRWLEIQSDAFE